MRFSSYLQVSSGLPWLLQKFVVSLGFGSGHPDVFSERTVFCMKYFFHSGLPYSLWSQSPRMLLLGTVNFMISIPGLFAFAKSEGEVILNRRHADVSVFLLVFFSFTRSRFYWVINVQVLFLVLKASGLCETEDTIYTYFNIWTHPVHDCCCTFRMNEM